jgi:hypothetical protein
MTLPIDRPALVVMTRRELEELPDADLMSRCAAPFARRMRVRSTADRHAFLRQLSGAQGALLAFWILSTHAEGGLSGFCTGHPHRMVDDNFWMLLQTGLRRLADGDMLALTDRLRTEVRRALLAGGYREDPGDAGEPDQASFERLVEGLERLDPAVMRLLDDEYRQILPGSLRLVARLSREHADELVAIEV